MSASPSLPNTESRLVTFRNAFIAGALLLAPLIVTVWAFAPIIALVGGTAEDVVRVMVEGRIIRSGGAELALELEERGYDWVRETIGA